MDTYAPHRHRLPLIRSRISSGVRGGDPASGRTSSVAALGQPAACSSITAIAEQICPGVQ
jgi:hypothetical protein